MRFSCPKCGAHAVRFGDAACPACGLPLTVGAVLKQYVQNLKARTLTQCPNCRKPIPITSKTCPECQTAFSVQGAVQAVTAPARGRIDQLTDKPTATTKRRFQRLYIFLSVALLVGLLIYVSREQQDALFEHALLSVAYVVGFALLAKLFVPARVFLAVSKRASRVVKFTLILNLLSVLLLLQIVIGVWWKQAAVLAGVFGVIIGSAWLLREKVWPNSEWIQGFFFGNEPGDDSFDPVQRQGRVARHDASFDPMEPQGRAARRDD